MHGNLAAVLDACPVPLVLGDDGIWSAELPAASGEQAAEREMRTRIAARTYDDYLGTIARHHSIPVMDREVERFVARLPASAVVLDVGGSWGWHWGALAEQRPDVGVVIVDFVRTNLRHAQKVLGAGVGNHVALVHADATALPFADAGVTGFDGVWTVQTFQHIPDFERACREAWRVLKRGGRFVNYSLHATPLNKALYRVLGKKYHTAGALDSFHLTRANDAQLRAIQTIFGGPVDDRYTECFFHPDLKLSFSGRSNSAVGRLDARLAEVPGIARWVARQRSFEAVKA